ncbi:TRAP transporter large permease [Bacillus piscicola]|uniref:TRAP transporter large permease n=1 Tax=Bacillus piscicola TaxID=1632684 RepID=UPI001F08A283|nr:TRAP transporter large permease [Bacillus piscicola]
MIIIVVTVLFAMVLMSMPIGFALAITGLIFLLFFSTVSLEIIPVVMFDGVNSFPLLAIPLFMIAGELMNACDLTRRLINFATSMIGFMRGALAHVTVLTSLFFAEISGSATADAAALGSVLIPEMRKKNYPAGFAVTLVACASTMAILIPPSMNLILYGVIAGVDIGQMFMAGIIPGILVGLTLMVLSYFYAKKYNFGSEAPFSLKNVWQSFKEAFWALLLPIIILGGILGGIFTPTEAAGVAVITALLIGVFIYKKLKWRDLPSILLGSAKHTAVIMMIISGSALLGWYITNAQLAQEVAASVLAITENKQLILIIINILFLMVGMILHASAAVIMLVPILMPLVNQIGIDPVHFGIILTVNLAIGQQTPPVASVLLTACQVGNTRLVETLPFLKYFILAMLLVLLLVTYITSISLFIPNLLN